MWEAVLAFVICGLFGLAAICLAVYLFVEIVDKFIDEG